MKAQTPTQEAMSGDTMIAPNAIVSRTGIGRAWDVASDVVLAIALIWAVPLLIGLVAAVLRRLL